MAKAKFIFPVEGSRPSDFSYPDNCHFTVIQNDTIQIHEIYYDAAPAALFNYTPNGSRLWDAKDGRLYLKTGGSGLGAIDGVWKYQAINT